MINLGKFKAAAVQAAPVYLDAEGTVDKACRLIGDAATAGARLVAFPEAFVPGYPYWNWIKTPLAGSEWFEKLYRASIDVPGDCVSRLCVAAREAGVYVVIGINERDNVSLGTIYNSTLIIGADGELLGRHRKLVPTWAEKLTWTGGDGSGLNVYRTELAPIGVLACGENTNTLARFALLAQGELVHVATYIALPVATNYDMVEAIKIRAGAHSFEGKIFTIVSCSTINEDMIRQLTADDPDGAALLRRQPNAFSGIFGPDGRLMTEPLIDIEGIVYAEIDLGKCIQPKQMHDIIGHYNRFDIFDLRLNKDAKTPLTISYERHQPDVAAGGDTVLSDPTLGKLGTIVSLRRRNGGKGE